MLCWFEAEAQSCCSKTTSMHAPCQYDVVTANSLSWGQQIQWDQTWATAVIKLRNSSNKSYLHWHQNQRLSPDDLLITRMPMSPQSILWLCTGHKHFSIEAQLIHWVHMMPSAATVLLVKDATMTKFHKCAVRTAWLKHWVLVLLLTLSKQCCGHST